MRISIEERFWSKVNFTNSCWLWVAGKNQCGYGMFRIGVSKKVAHRVAYEWLVGVIPEGLEIDHLCRVRNCVRPSHLELVTHRENMNRGDTELFRRHQAYKIYCLYNHEYSVENTYINPKGHRYCRECHRVTSQRDRDKKRIYA